MDRRHFLQAAVMITGGFATRAIARLAQSGNTLPIPQAPAAEQSYIKAFTAAQQQNIAAMAEVIIPRTETPGAVDAGVPSFIEHMVAQWLQPDEREIFMFGLARLESQCQRQYRRSFSQLAPSQQLTLMDALEEQASNSPWYDFANVQRQYIEDAPFICQLKELVIFGFYSSEVGANQVLRHDPMPMGFDGELILSAGDSSWSTIRTM